MRRRLAIIVTGAALLILAGALWWGRYAPSQDGDQGAAMVNQTDPAEWRALLQELSDLAIADPEIRAKLSDEQVANRWLGEAPATDAQIAAAEKRLRITLPPTYVAFLKVSNGWNYPDPFVVRLASTDEIEWTRIGDPRLIQGWREGASYAAEQYGPAPPGPEDHLADTLMVSRPHPDDDGAYYMLNPKTRHGAEMESWFFSHWNPGAVASPSFWNAMVRTRDSMRAMAERPTR